MDEVPDLQGVTAPLTIINTKSDWKTKSGAGNCLLNVSAICLLD
jgi:hypothetical protein